MLQRRSYVISPSWWRDSAILPDPTTVYMEQSARDGHVFSKGVNFSPGLTAFFRVPYVGEDWNK